ncbi:MAG: DUF6493 family protein [Catenulispora sp.]
MTEIAISGADGSAERLTSLLERGNPDEIAAFFEGMAEKERRTFVKLVRAQLKALAWGTYADDPSPDRQEFKRRRTSLYRTQVPAALAVFGGPVALAKYLRSVQREIGLSLDRAVVHKVLTDRDPAWLPELADVLADTLDSRDSWHMVDLVATVAGAVPVASPEYVRAWAARYPWFNGKATDAALPLDPRMAELLPLVFDDDENDDLFAASAGFRDAALEAVDKGQMPRGPMLDASLRRLLRGGRTATMQNHLAFWNDMKPTDEEIAERISTCISLLPAQNSTVAKTFLGSVKKVCDAGLADLELALEAASIAVTRPEKYAVDTALGWLDALATANPERVSEIVGIIATAFGAQAAAVQERAVKLIGKRAGALGEEDRQRLVAEAGVCLAPDLASALARSLGAEPDTVPVEVGYSDVAPYVPRPLRPPIGSPAELAEAVAALLHGDPAEAMVFERLVEAFVVFARTDAAALREALAPVVERERPRWEYTRNHPATPRAAVLGLAEAAVEPEARRHPHRAGVHQLWERMLTRTTSYIPLRSRTSPADVLILRAAEIRFALGLPDLPPLVSVPTAANGIIEPAALAARLRECEAKGWVPLEADFHQALLRLPVDCGDVDTTGFASAAGRRFAAWVAGDRVELPAFRLPDADPQERDRARQWSSRPNPYMDRVRASHTMPPHSLLDLAPGMWIEPERQYDGSDWAVCWPAILPAHPDLPALSLAGGWDWNTARPSPESAGALAEQDDPVHAGTHYVIATRLLHAEAPMRASGVDAALILAARGLLDPRRLAARLAGCLAIEPTSGLRRRLVPSLRDLANGGAPGQSWEAIAALLPQTLPPAVPKAMTGSADLLNLGAELAGALKVRTPIAEVSALAEQKGGTVAVNAARRLAGVLAAD